MTSATSSVKISFSAEQLLEMDASWAKEIFSQGEEAVVFALLALTKRANEAASNSADPSVSPATPSAMIPTYQKPPVKKRKKKSGAKPGHAGSRRESPERVDHFKTHRAATCPDCGNPLNRCRETRKRYIEEIPDV